MTYQPLNEPCYCCRKRPAERGYWTTDSSSGTTRRYCWLCYRHIIDSQHRGD